MKQTAEIGYTYTRQTDIYVYTDIKKSVNLGVKRCKEQNPLVVKKGNID